MKDDTNPTTHTCAGEKTGSCTHHFPTGQVSLHANSKGTPKIRCTGFFGTLKFSNCKKTASFTWNVHLDSLTFLSKYKAIWKRCSNPRPLIFQDSLHIDIHM